MKKIGLKILKNKKAITYGAIAIVLIEMGVFAIIVTNKITQLEDKLDKFKLYDQMYNESMDQRWEYENDNGLIREGEIY